MWPHDKVAHLHIIYCSMWTGKTVMPLLEARKIKSIFTRQTRSPWSCWKKKKTNFDPTYKTVHTQEEWRQTEINSRTSLSSSLTCEVSDSVCGWWTLSFELREFSSHSWCLTHAGRILTQHVVHDVCILCVTCKLSLGDCWHWHVKFMDSLSLSAEVMCSTQWAGNLMDRITQNSLMM